MIGFAVAPIATLIAINVVASFFYLGNFVFKGILVAVGSARSTEDDDLLAIEARALTEDELPIYTVLVPMYREPEMLPHLADALRKLDYPLGKLDIKLVLEAGDTKPSRSRARSASKACSKSFACRRRSRRRSRRPAISRWASRAANSW